MVEQKENRLSKVGAWIATGILAPIIVGVVLWGVQNQSSLPYWLRRSTPTPTPTPRNVPAVEFSQGPTVRPDGNVLAEYSIVKNVGGGVARNCRGHFWFFGQEATTDLFSLAEGEDHEVSLSIPLGMQVESGFVFTGYQVKVLCENAVMMHPYISLPKGGKKAKK